MTGPIALSGAGSAGRLPVPGDRGGGGGKAVSRRPTMKKAALTLYDHTPATGGSKPGGQRGSIDFQFNPKEVTITKSAKWEHKPGKHGQRPGPPEFTGPEPCKLTLEMFFDGTASRDGSVVKAVESLFACCIPTDPTNLKSQPPLVVLHWGSISSFPAFVTSVSAKYTLFGTDGTPIRAVCSVALEEMPGEPWRQNPTSGSHDVRRVHCTVAGDTLASIAYAQYGDPGQWRAVAAYNGIDDPMRLPTGHSLLLPSLEELGVAG
jgi:nucleoid-associated protein YgaU